MKFVVDDCKAYDFTKSSMSENREFLYKITKKIKPKLIVELGTYYGCSYFSFAQAIKDNRLATKLVGIDTWEGDTHTGLYNDTVFETFRDLRDKFAMDGVIDYSQFDYKRSRFKDAVDSFEDNSIDILMIDGTHTAEAAKEDFETYLPKLSENAIVLFHDTTVKRFSLHKYWNKISRKYVSFNIENRFGLGILAPKGVGNFQAIKNLFGLPKITIYSSIIGGKDNIKSQVFQTYPVDQIMYTDLDVKVSKGWRIVDAKESGIPRVSAKYYKLQSHLYNELHGYDYVIWIDGSIQIINTRFVEMLINKMKATDSPIGLIPHPDRDCIYDEYDACVEIGRIKTDKEKQVALEQLKRYKRQSIMPHSGLYAGTCFIRDMNHPDIVKFNELWMNEVKHGSIRDQLSLPYVLTKLNIKPTIIDINLWSNQYFKVNKHLK